MDKTTFILLYKAMVRPHLEYANAMWCPYKKGDIKRIEKVKKKTYKANHTFKASILQRNIKTASASHFDL